MIDLPTELAIAGDSEDVVLLTEVGGKPHAPGKLVAFDPATQSIRWSVDHSLPYNGGLMATGGNLVFQGNAEGEMVAYAANTGEELWSVQTGSAIIAAPASYSIDGTQYVLIPIGMAGGLQYRYPDMHAANRKQGPVRLMAFSLSGNAEVSGAAAEYPSLPEQPALEASDQMIALGGELYDGYCSYCHGPEGAARFGGSIPDLRYANKDTHATWHGIVVGGLRSANGMPSMEISIEESEAIRSYVLGLSEAIRASQ